MGRPRKPLAQKLLDGDQKCRIYPVVEGRGKLGEPPARLDEVAAACWIEVRDSAPWLTGSDALALELLATTYSDWRKCCDIIDRDGMVLTTVKVHRSMVRGETGRTVKRRRHPLFPAMMASAKFIAYMTDQLGLNPSARRRIGIDAKPTVQAGDKLVEFMRDR